MNEREKFYRAVDLLEIAVDALAKDDGDDERTTKLRITNASKARCALRSFGKLLPGRKERER